MRRGTRASVNRDGEERKKETSDETCGARMSKGGPMAKGRQKGKVGGRGTEDRRAVIITRTGRAVDSPARERRPKIGQRR